jgi:hypothetical protein
MDFQIRTRKEDNSIITQFNWLEMGWVSYTTLLYKTWNVHITVLTSENSLDVLDDACRMLKRDHTKLIKDFKLGSEEETNMAITRLCEEYITVMKNLHKGQLKLHKANVEREKTGLAPINVAMYNFVCANCSIPFSDVLKPKKCSKCMMTNYCGHECQKADWKKHKLSCGKDIVLSVL